MRPAIRLLGRLVSAGLVVLVALVVYLRLDRTEVFHEIRGVYRGFDLLRAWESAESTVRLIELRNDRGVPVTEVYVRRPSDLAPDHRIVLTYAGVTTGEKILALFPERADLVLVAVQYPYRSPENWLELLRWPYDARRTGYRTVAGGMLAIDYLIHDEGLAADRVVLVGSSLGSIPATIHGALDERVPTVILVHGGGNIPALVRAGVSPRILAPAAGLAAWILLDTFDPLHYVDRIAPRRLLMIATRNDRYFPVRSAKELYEAADEPKEIIWTESPHVSSEKTPLVDQLLETIDSRL